MQFQQLRYFIEVAHTGNITTAARNLFISQPSLSQQMINLEKELGIQLLIRHAKSVTLSDAGEQFLVHAQRIVGETEQLSELMKKHSLLEKGTLRIGMLWIAGYLKFPDILYNYQKLHPGLTYDLKIDGSDALLKMLLLRKLHAAFIISNDQFLLQHKELFFHKLTTDRYVVVVSSKSPLARRESVSIRDLRDEPLILPDRDSAFFKQLKRYFDQYMIEPNAICETSQTDMVIQLASKNFGVGFSSRSIANTLQTKDFKILDLEEALTRPVYYVTLTELLDYPSIRIFTRYVTHYRLHDDT